MNYLSWLIYTANVLENLGPLFIFAGLALLVFSIMRWIPYWAECDNRYSSKEDRDAKKPKNVGVLAFLVFLCLLLAALCPSKDTMYAIAASQLGEQVIKAPVVGKAEKALESWLDKQISKNEAEAGNKTSSDN
jgi:hypothetical protein